MGYLVLGGVLVVLVMVLVVGCWIFLPPSSQCDRGERVVVVVESSLFRPSSTPGDHRRQGKVVMVVMKADRSAFPPSSPRVNLGRWEVVEVSGLTHFCFLERLLWVDSPVATCWTCE